MTTAGNGETVLDTLALQWTGKNSDVVDKFFNGPKGSDCFGLKGDVWCVATPEGLVDACVGDWIIRTVEGVFHVCTPKVFETTYEEVP